MASELPYVIVYAVLFFVIIGLGLYIMHLYMTLHYCQTDPNIWCYDYECAVQCPLNTATPPQAINPSNQVVNICYNSTAGFSGLVDCLYGPNSAQANACIADPTTPDTDEPACPCAIGGTSNCLAGCAQTITSPLLAGTTCCCVNCPGNTQGCKT